MEDPLLSLGHPQRDERDGWDGHLSVEGKLGASHAGAPSTNRFTLSLRMSERFFFFLRFFLVYIWKC